jgi:hypothetical protein
MTDRPTVFCKDCKFMRKGWTMPLSLALCGHPSAISLDGSYLTNATPRRSYCSSMRYESRPCGPNGKLWEPRR